MSRLSAFHRTRPGTLSLVAAALVGAVLPGSAYAATGASTVTGVTGASTAAGTVAVGTAVAEVVPAAAAAPDVFVCWSRPLEAVVKAGPGPQHCVADQVGGAQGVHMVGGVQVEAVNATGSTTRTATPAAGTTAVGTAAVSTTQGASANATATSARLVVNKSVIQVGAVTSVSRISCTYNATGARYTFNGASTVRSLRIDGKIQRLGVGLRTFHIPGGGTLYLDRIQVGPTGVVVQAAVLDTPKAHVVIGESAVDLAPGQANPCR